MWRDDFLFPDFFVGPIFVIVHYIFFNSFFGTDAEYLSRMLMLDDDWCDEDLLLSDSTAEIRASTVSASSPLPTVVIDKTPAAVAAAAAATVS